MESLPDKIDNARSAATRNRTTFRHVITGSTQCFIPNLYDESKLLNRKRKAEREQETLRLRNVHAQFSYEICQLSSKAHHIMAACNILGYSCSQEGMIAISLGTLRAFLDKMGIKDITDEEIAKALPSRATSDKYETKLADDCLLQVWFEIVQDSKGFNVIKIILMTDHGHRNKQDSYVKIVVWAGLDSEKKWTVKFYCLDVNIGGHSAVAAAEAVKISLETFTSTIEDMADGKKVEVECLTRDLGGVAAAQRLHPALVNLSVMDELSRYLGCDMHGMNKPLEVSCVEVFGKKGIGVETPFQMLWLFVQIFKKVRDEYNHEIMNEMWGYQEISSGVSSLIPATNNGARTMFK